MMKRVVINWYALIYKIGDSDLIAKFWKFYNTHKIKSKNRAARCVLLKYYSTTPAPKWVIDAFSLYSSIKACKVNLYEDVL